MKITYQYITFKSTSWDDNEDISNIVVTMIDAALFATIPLSRWMKIVSIMIEKGKLI